MTHPTSAKKYKALDRFEVIDELGQGAGSRILHIRDPESFQHYAMKVVVRRTAEEDKYIEQAEHEFRVAQKLDHPALEKIYDIRVIKKWFRVREVRTLLEYINGQTLEQMKEPPVPLLVLVFAEVAGAVHHMHRRGVFHADLKPNNVLVSQSGQVKVIDFGLAWLRGEQKHRVQGTPGYLAPEQIQHRIVTESTDIFNFGATMYRLLTGRLASGVIAVGGNFIPALGVVPPPHELNAAVPIKLSELVTKSLEIKPHRRPQSMNEVAEKLGEILTALQLTADDLPRLLRHHERGGDEKP